MSSWGHRQQAKYISGFIILVAVIFGVLIYFGFFNHQPTCFDNIQNGDETGLDCGGSCLKICPADELDPIILWTRLLEIRHGLYSEVIYLENPNSKLMASNVPYRIKMFDTQGVVIGEKYGNLFIAPNKTFPIFEGSIDTGNSLAVKATFEFLAPPVWRRASSTEPVLDVSNKNLSNTDSKPRLEATLENPTPYDLKKIEAIALIYDGGGNVIAASRTIVDSLPKGEKAPLTFTWQTPFTAAVGKVDILINIPLEYFIPNQ